MKSFFVYIKQLPKPIKLSTTLYFGSSLLYTCIGSYTNSKNYLFKYRNKELHTYEIEIINSEWDAVKYGASVDFFERFLNAVVWPYSITKNIIPSVVLFLNKEEKKEN